MEVDERQVNLRRFSLFFPEKREFFPRGPRDIRLWLSRENLEKLCWNHLCITNSDTQMTLLRITAQPGYEDLRTILKAILRGNLETFDVLTETVCETSPSEELSPRSRP